MRPYPQSDVRDIAMYTNDPITVLRECDAILIPTGTPISLSEGSLVFITQALGGNYTVNINGNLAQVGPQDADALGFDPADYLNLDLEPNADGSVNEAHLWEQMRTCYDPEIPINIVELGLVYDCQISRTEQGENQVDVLMTLTAPACGMGDFLAADVQTKVAMAPNVDQVTVELTFDPPWNPEMMSEAARLETGLL